MVNNTKKYVKRYEEDLDKMKELLPAVEDLMVLAKDLPDFWSVNALCPGSIHINCYMMPKGHDVIEEFLRFEEAIGVKAQDPYLSDSNQIVSTYYPELNGKRVCVFASVSVSDNCDLEYFEETITKVKLSGACREFTERIAEGA